MDEKVQATIDRAKQRLVERSSGYADTFGYDVSVPECTDPLTEEQARYNADRLRQRLREHWRKIGSEQFDHEFVRTEARKLALDVSPAFLDKFHERMRVVPVFTTPWKWLPDYGWVETRLHRRMLKDEEIDVGTAIGAVYYDPEDFLAYRFNGKDKPPELVSEPESVREAIDHTAESVEDPKLAEAVLHAKPPEPAYSEEHAKGLPDVPGIHEALAIHKRAERNGI